MPASQDLPLNLCHFDISVDGRLLPRAEEPLLLKPKLGPVYRIGGVPVRNLHGYREPQAARLLGMKRVQSRDRSVIVPRFAPAVSVARGMGLFPLCIPEEAHAQRGQPGPVEVQLKDLSTPPPGLAFEYQNDFPCPLDDWSAVGELRDYEPYRGPEEWPPLVRLLGGPFPVRVAGGPTLEPVPEEQSAGVLYGIPRVPSAPPRAAVLVPHNGVIIRHYQKEGHIVLVTSTVNQDGSVHLYRVA